MNDPFVWIRFFFITSRIMSHSTKVRVGMNRVHGKIESSRHEQTPKSRFESAKKYANKIEKYEPNRATAQKRKDAVEA